MVSYRITSPVKQGTKDGKPFLVVDIIQYVGFSIIKRATIRKEEADKFLKAVFGENFEPPEEIKKRFGNK